jgi:hypothetical protein
LNAANDRFTHAVRITETHFAFCRVHVYIHRRGIQLKKKERNWVLPFHERGVVAFANRPCDQTAFNRAAIYENELLTAGLSAQTCLADKSADSNLERSSVTDFDQALQQLSAVQIPDAITKRCCSW